jgi:tetratricopeptide (TPR) repeat protein
LIKKHKKEADFAVRLFFMSAVIFHHHNQRQELHMPGRIEKTVFISYRRADYYIALAVYQDLTRHGYDVFFDYESIKSGDFEQNIIQNIKGRAHFIVILTPLALKRCNEQGDWLRREIELALEVKRNIVPLMFDNFNFDDPEIKKYLTGKMELLKKYNGLHVFKEYHEAAMDKLRDDRLSVEVDTVLHPLSDTVQKVVQEFKVLANKEPQVTQKVLTAQFWFENGQSANDDDKAIECYNEAINLKPDFAFAFNYRGVARYNKGNLDGAIRDFDEAIRLKPDFIEAFNNRRRARSDKGDSKGAKKDYAEFQRLSLQETIRKAVERL